MKDYNLYYYYLEVATDASADEIDEVFRQEEVRLKKIIERDWDLVRQGSIITGAPTKFEAHLKHIEDAHGVLMNPETRKAYHEERYPSSSFAEEHRRVLSLCARVAENGCWPPVYMPRRQGPTPSSYEAKSGCALIALGFIALASGLLVFV